MWLLAFSNCLPFHIRFTHCMACEPLIRITAIPPVPGAVEIAHIVSAVSVILLRPICEIGIVILLFVLFVGEVRRRNHGLLCARHRPRSWLLPAFRLEPDRLSLQIRLHEAG